MPLATYHLASELANLRKFIEGHFSLVEMKTLAFDLGIDYESLPYETKTEFAMELISYCERKSMLSPLVASTIKAYKGAPHELAVLRELAKKFDLLALIPSNNTDISGMWPKKWDWLRVPIAVIGVVICGLFIRELWRNSGSEKLIATEVPSLKRLPNPQTQLPTDTVIQTPATIKAGLITSSTVLPIATATVVSRGPEGSATVDNLTTRPLVLSVEGVGKARDSESNPALRRRSAVRAAELDAQRNLAQWLSGAKIDAVTEVSGNTFISDTIRETISTQISGTTVISEDYDVASGIATVTLQINIYSK